MKRAANESDRSGAPPSAQRGILARPRIEPLLDRACDYAVVLVCAPAGSGKSVLVGDWARRRRPESPVAWLTCSSTSDSPAALWSAVSGALSRTVGHLVPGAAAPTLAAVPADREQLLDSLIRWLARLPENTVLVCDDFQEISSAATHRDLQYVIDRLPAGLTLILITRSYPPLAIHRARVEGRLLDIRSGELAFTREETRELLAMHGLELDDEDLDLLQERTKGWAAGLRLAMISMTHADRPTEVVRQLARSPDAISGYLTEEVLAQLHPDDRDFLLRTCIVDELTPPLAERLLGQGGGVGTLDGVAGRIGFLHHVPGSADRYAYHPMFAELLRRELQHSDPAQYSHQHRIAAHWYESNGQALVAISHAQLAEDWSLAARLGVDNVMTVALRGRIVELSGIVAGFPHDFAATDGQVLLISALAAAFGNQPDRTERLLNRAEAALPTGGGLPERRARAVARYIRSVLARIHGDAAAVLRAATADGPDIPGPDDTGFMPADREIWSGWRASRAAALLWDDQLPAALQCATRACDDVRSGAGGWPMVTGLGVTSMVLALHGRLTAAQEAVDELARFVSAREWSDAPYVAIADFGAAWVALERGEVATAERNIAAAETRYVRMAGSFPEVMIGLLRARLTAVAGDGPQSAREMLAKVERERGYAARLPRRLADLIRLEIALAVGDFSSAIDLAGSTPAFRGYVDIRAGRSLPDRPERPPEPDLGLWVRILLATAVAQHRTGNVLRADRVLDQALELTALEGFRLAYQQLGEPLRRVLVESPVSAIRHGQLIASLLAETSRERGRSADLVDPLSIRELDVLRHIVAGRDTDEIAGDLFVSRNTVRTHTKNIYRKLSVQSRRDAMLRAAALGLV